MSNVHPLPQEFSVPVEDLNPAILSISDIDQAPINPNRVRRFKLSWTSPFHSPAEQEVAAFVELHNSHIDVAIGHVDVAVTVDRHILWLIKFNPTSSCLLNPPQYTNPPPSRSHL